jgi:hypothetical protein
MNSKLTLITVAPPLSHYVTLAGVSTKTMFEELDKWAADILRKAAAALPDDVVAHRVQRRGHPGPKILEEAERGGYDIVVLGTRGRGRAQERLLGSVNGYSISILACHCSRSQKGPRTDRRRSPAESTACRTLTRVVAVFCESLTPCGAFALVSR